MVDCAGIMALKQVRCCVCLQKWGYPKSRSAFWKTKAANTNYRLLHYVTQFLRQRVQPFFSILPAQMASIISQVSVGQAFVFFIVDFLHTFASNRKPLCVDMFYPYNMDLNKTRAWKTVLKQCIPSYPGIYLALHTALPYAVIIHIWWTLSILGSIECMYSTIRWVCTFCSGFPLSGKSGNVREFCFD